MPCATGEEPYSIAIWLLEHWPEVDAYDIEIVGSDVDTRVLEAAREGVFGRRALMRLSPELIAKYFLPIDDNSWRIIPELRQKIFEVFYSTRGGGTGLGLPIAQKILETHGGWIDLETEIGRGTTFILHLRCVNREP